ncbi:nitrite reductase [Sporomusaceae bacterium FL31]|nr:nitrite reductase [Sporomusaceae bacterium FL31]GCE34196.1 nitrite reductase [Sporomusaceae bacterium]
MAAKPDYKKYGFIPQVQPGLLVMRIRNKAGNMTAAQMRSVAELAERYANGQVHVTTRQAVEIPGVKEEFFEEALAAIRAADLLPAVCGPRVRPVVACPGTDTCPYGLLSARALAEKLDDDFVGRDLPAKTKFAVSSCPNSCTKPQANDVGFKGVVEPLVDQAACVKCGACVRRCPAKAMVIENAELVIDYNKCLACGVCIKLCPKKALQVGRKGYHIYVGGKGGRYQYDGQLIAEYITEESVLDYLEAVLATYQELAEKGERLNSVVAKTGIAELKVKIEAKL